MYIIELNYECIVFCAELLFFFPLRDCFLCFHFTCTALIRYQYQTWKYLLFDRFCCLSSVVFSHRAPASLCKLIIRFLGIECVIITCKSRSFLQVREQCTDYSTLCPPMFIHACMKESYNLYNWFVSHILPGVVRLRSHPIWFETSCQAYHRYTKLYSYQEQQLCSCAYGDLPDMDNASELILQSQKIASRASTKTRSMDSSSVVMFRQMSSVVSTLG